MELTLPGFRHDVCSTILPLALGVAVLPDGRPRGPRRRAHPPRRAGRAPARRRSGGRARAVGGATAAGLGGEDGRAWRRLFGPLVRDAGQARTGDPPARRPSPAPPAGARPVRAPGPPLGARAGARPVRGRARPGALRRDLRPRDARPRSPVECLVRARPRDVRARGRLADGRAAARRPWRRRSSPSSRRPAARSSPTIGSTRWRTCRAARAVLFDTGPHQLAAIAGDRLSGAARRRAERFRYGSGVFKVDWALDGPVPWAAEGPRRAATVHLGGTLDEIAAAEADVAAGRHPERPYVLFVQYAPWDTSRAPAARPRRGPTATCRRGRTWT